MSTDHAARSSSRRVFISYAQQDRDLVAKLARRLADAGLSVSDPLISLSPGDNILASISDTIEHADVFVILISPKSADSNWVQAEAAMAVGRVLSGRGGRIVPVLLGDVQIPFILRDFQGVRLRDESDFDKVVEAARSTRSESPSGHALTRSVEYQERALEHAIIEYDLEHRSLLLERYRVVRTMIIALTTFAVAVSFAAALLVKSELLTSVLTPAIGLLGTLLGFYFGRESRRR
jgi:TIR domain